VSLAGIAIVAAVVVLALLVLVELTARVVHARFFSTVILGEDGRTSTSKTFILLWTLLVGWALIALLIAGEFVSAHACVPPSDIANAAQKCKAAADDVGLLQVGWLHFLHAGLSGSYLLLLGVPAAAGVAAKGIAQSKAQNGSSVKPASSGGPAAPFARIAEIFSADDGTTDIGDFQYLIFNLVTAAYFVSQFLNPDGSGLPTIPDTLLGLTSVSAGLYVGKKAVTNSQPSVTGVFPLPLHDSQPFTVIGVGLTADQASPTDAQPQITIDGVPATAVRAVGTNLTAIAPPNLGPGGVPMIRQLRVLNPYGAITPDFPVQCL
jgi:hypothetical protein